MKSFTKRFVAFFFLTGCFLAAPKEARAAFTLSVVPQRGVHGISFEQSKPGTFLRNEEVTVSVNTDRAAQYIIYQTVYEPLTNEFGNTIPQEDFIVFSPSNSLGTLKTQLETPVTMGQSSFYTSNAAGESDSFVLAYTVKVPENQAGGVYRTRITFTAQPVTATAGASQSVVTLDVRVDVRTTFHVRIENADGSSDLNLGHISKNRPAAEGNLKIEIESNTGPYRITQQLADSLASQEGETIKEDDFKFIAFGGDGGNLSAKGMPLQVPLSAETLYASESGGGDNISVQYLVSPVFAQKAGIYMGILSFKVESNAQGLVTETINIPVKMEIESIFYLDLEMEQPGKVQFGVFRAREETRQKKVALWVHSNLGKPYQVTQIVANKFVNEAGEALPAEHFTYFGSEAQTGTLARLSPMPVTEGESVVFTSDNKGTPEHFTLEYDLSSPRNPKAGNYSTAVKYSLTTL